MSSKRSDKEESLVERFIASFEKLDEMATFSEASDPIAWQLAIGDLDEYGRKRWKPIRVNTESSSLNSIYDKLPARFPSLFERLVLSYRWAEVDLKSFRLLANPPGPDLTGLLQQITGAPNIWSCLSQTGYIQFGKGPDIDFDPVCFDIKSREKNGDYRIVKIDHEEILCNNRLKIVAEMAPSFEQLMLQTIEQADQVG